MKQTKTFECQCGHLAYYIPRHGWLCMCANPQRKQTVSDVIANIRAKVRAEIKKGISP